MNRVKVNNLMNPRLSILKKLPLTLACFLLLICSVNAVLAQSTVVRAVASSSELLVDESLTVDITISNVQNLAGLDVFLQWNSSVLSLSNVALNLGVSSHSNGVLYGNNLNYDYDTITAGDIYVNETESLGSYELLAQSVGQSTQSFSGSGTIATLTFTVINAGSAGLLIESELADHPAAGEVANLIEHTDTADSVNVIPEFTGLIIIALLIAAATSVLIVSKKKLNRQ